MCGCKDTPRLYPFALSWISYCLLNKENKGAFIFDVEFATCLAGRSRFSNMIFRGAAYSKVV